MVDGGRPLGPGMGAFVECWLELLRSRGAEPCFGKYLENELRSADALDEVHVRKVTIPISGKGDGTSIPMSMRLPRLNLHVLDAEENKLGLAWKVNMVRVARDLPTRFSEQGITVEVAKQHVEELEDPERNITTDMYFSWASKRRL